MSPLAWLVALAAAPLALGQFIRAGHRHCYRRRPLRLEVDVTVTRLSRDLDDAEARGGR
jgi:hypothetical protein